MNYRLNHGPISDKAFLSPRSPLQIPETGKISRRGFDLGEIYEGERAFWECKKTVTPLPPTLSLDEPSKSQENVLKILENKKSQSWPNSPSERAFQRLGNLGFALEQNHGLPGRFRAFLGQKIH
jgi:hypothetical protein